MLLTTQNYKFSNGLDVELSNYYNTQKQKTEKFILETENKLKEILKKEEYPLGVFLSHLEKKLPEHFNLVSVEAIKNMFIRVIKEDGKKEKNYLDGEQINLEMSIHFKNTFLNLLFKQNRHLDRQIKRFTLFDAQYEFLSTLMRQPYNKKFDISDPNPINKMEMNNIKSKLTM